MDIAVECLITGRTWDLREPKDIAKAKEMLRKDRPRLLVVSPPCTLFNNLQNLSGGPDPARLAEAIQMFEVAIDMCIQQARQGGIFVLEHPLTSQAWKLPAIGKLRAVENYQVQEFHMCAFGMTSQDGQGVAPVLKPTRVACNAFAMATSLNRRCANGKCPGHHRHLALLNGRAKAAAHYPRALCDAFLRGLDVEDQARRELNHMRGGEDVHDMCDPGDLEGLAAAGGMWSKDGGTEGKRSGQPLTEADLHAWRAKEMGTFKEFGVYEYVRRQDHPHAKIIDTTWVDNWGKQESRLCGREFADEKRNDLFAPTPSWLASRWLLSEAATARPDGSESRVMVVDVSRAFLYGAARRELLIKLRREDPRFGEPSVYGLLRKSMYRTQDTPQIWAAEVQKVFHSMGFKSSVTNPCVYSHQGRGILMVAHVDDFLMVGPRRELDAVYKT